MTKEFLTNSGTKHGLLAVTTLGAVEGAAIAIPWGFPASSIFGGIVGGGTAFTAEVSRRAVNKALHNSPESPKQVTQPFGDQNTSIDISVESISVTKRTDVPEEEAQPIVKSNTEQVTGVTIQEMPNAIQDLRMRTRANAFPTWQTTLQEKTIASAMNASAYNHTPTRVG